MTFSQELIDSAIEAEEQNRISEPHYFCTNQEYNLILSIYDEKWLKEHVAKVTRSTNYEI